MTTSKPSSESSDIAREVLQLAQRVRAIHGIRQTYGVFKVARDLSDCDYEVHSLNDEADVTVAGDTLVVSQDFGIRALAKQGEEDPVADGPLLLILATFHMTYDLSGDAIVSDEVAKAFATINAKFNLTSFWREYVQNCCARSGIAPLEVRPYNAAKALSELRDAAGQGSSASEDPQ